MALFNNLGGTLQSIFSIGKGSNQVDIRTNSGVIQARNNGGAWSNILGQGGSSNIYIQSSTPSSPVAYTTIWIDTTNAAAFTMKVYNGSSWIPVSTWS